MTVLSNLKHLVRASCFFFDILGNASECCVLVPLEFVLRSLSLRLLARRTSSYGYSEEEGVFHTLGTSRPIFGVPTDHLTNQINSQ